MTADFALAMEQKRHVHAETGPQSRGAIDINPLQREAICSQQRFQPGCHVFAEMAAGPAE